MDTITTLVASHPILGWIVLTLIAWNLAPLLVVMVLPGVPVDHKARACASLLWSGVKGLAVVIPSLLAPVVVPIALLFTHRFDDHLPALFRWWDNDVSINGDRPEYWPAHYRGTTYYADAHPRSFWARYIWLGWRNRASWLAQRLGYLYQPGDLQDRETWGDRKTGRDHAGWALNRVADVYQLYMVWPIGLRLCLRTNVGHKIWSGYDNRPRAMVINITASVLSWKGA